MVKSREQHFRFRFRRVMQDLRNQLYITNVLPARDITERNFSSVTDMIEKICFLLGFLCVLVLLPVVTVARWQDGHDGVDRPGGNLDSSPHVMNKTSRPEDCAALCSQTNNCVAWTFEKSNCDNVGNQSLMCWLKGRITSQVLAGCRVRKHIHASLTLGFFIIAHLL